MGRRSICLHSKLKAIRVWDDVKKKVRTHTDVQHLHANMYVQKQKKLQKKGTHVLFLSLSHANTRTCTHTPLCSQACKGCCSLWSLEGSHCETSRLLSVFAPRVILVGARAPHIFLNTATTRGCLEQQGSARQLSRDVNSRAVSLHVGGWSA